jgi:hypothetical protein
MNNPINEIELYLQVVQKMRSRGYSESEINAMLKRPDEMTDYAKSESGSALTAPTSVAKAQHDEPSTVVSGSSSNVHNLKQTVRLETATEICRRVAEGESMRAIIKDKGMPSNSTFLRWAADDPEISRMYTQALQMRAALYADELVDLADRAGTMTEAHQIQALKLMVNTRQWIASRLLPRVYGERTMLEHTGEVKLDEKQINARLALLLTKAKIDSRA